MTPPPFAAGKVKLATVQQEGLTVLDFSETAVTSWLREVCPADDHMLPIRAIESEAAIPLAELARTIEATVASCPAEALTQALCESPLQDDLRAVLAQTGPARAMRLLHWLGETMPDPSAVAISLLSGDGADSRALHASVSATLRDAVLCRMFDQQRFEELRRACIDASQETA